MTTPTHCGATMIRNGKDRHKRQKYRCKACGATLLDGEHRQPGRTRRHENNAARQRSYRLNKKNKED